MKDIELRYRIILNCMIMFHNNIISDENILIRNIEYRNSCFHFRKLSLKIQK